MRKSPTTTPSEISEPNSEVVHRLYEPFYIDLSDESDEEYDGDSDDVVSSTSTTGEPEAGAELQTLLDEVREELKALPRKERDNPSRAKLPSEQAVADYLFKNAVSVADLKLLVLEFNTYPFFLMNKLATNVGLFHSRGQIEDSELEGIYTFLVGEAQNKAYAVMDKIQASVERFNSEKRNNEKRNKAGHPRKKEKTKRPRKPYVDPVWEEDVPKKKPAVKLPYRDYRFTNEIPASKPTEEVLNKWKHVEDAGAWGQTKPTSDWLFEEQTAKPVVNLPKSADHKETTPAPPQAIGRFRRIVPAMPDLNLLFKRRVPRSTLAQLSRPTSAQSSSAPQSDIQSSVADESGTDREKKEQRSKTRTDSPQDRGSQADRDHPGTYFAGD